MKLNEFENKIYKWFRPDLQLPMHVKRRIYNIYKFQIFNDVENVIDTELQTTIAEMAEDFKDFCDIHNIAFGVENIIEDFHACDTTEVQLETN